MRCLPLFLALALVQSITGLHAGEPKPYFSDWTVADTDERSLRSIKVRHADLYSDGLTPSEELELYRRLRQEFSTSLEKGLWSDHGDIGCRALLQIDEYINQVRGLDEVEAIVAAPDAAADARGDLTRELLQTNRFQARTGDELAYFSKDSRILLAEKDMPLYPDPVIIDLRARLDSLHGIALAQTADKRQRTIAGIEKARARWDAFIEGGYSQFPWEAWVNGLIDIGPFRSDIESPPSLQLVLLHPSLGLEVSTRELDQTTANETLIVECGFVHYYSDSDRGRFWGLSLIANLRDDVQPGLGVLMHLTSYLNAGVSWRDMPDNDRSRFAEAPNVILGVDLYKLLAPRADTIRKLLR